MDAEEFRYEIGDRYEEISEFRDIVNTWVHRFAIFAVATAPVNYALTEGNERLMFAGVLPAAGVLGAIAMSRSMNHVVDKYQNDLLHDAFGMDQDTAEE